MSTIYGASGPTISGPALLKSICGSNTVTRSGIILDRYKGRGSREATGYIESGIPVFINVNYEQVTGGPNPFPKDMKKYAESVKRVFDYYAKHKNKDLIIMSCENEENTKAYHSGPMADYLTMLRVFVDLAKQYDYKTTNGGIPVDSVINSAPGKSGKAGEIWELLTGFKDIDMTWVNLHTHNKNPKDNFDSDKIPAAVKKVKEVCGHDSVCNEFHMEPTGNVTVMTQLCKGWSDADVKYVVFLSGTSDDMVINQGNILTLIGKEYQNYIKANGAFKAMSAEEEGDLDVDEDVPVDEDDEEGQTSGE